MNSFIGFIIICDTETLQIVCFSWEEYGERKGNIESRPRGDSHEVYAQYRNFYKFSSVNCFEWIVILNCDLFVLKLLLKRIICFWSKLLEKNKLCAFGLQSNVEKIFKIVLIWLNF